mmetsp:Transcript_21094/g.49353  ORF Transcript_21094/g.49353 Transcript_21094/m.49353 type:complete len:287 (-) Transcript_21094:1613-2473(-)
MADGHRHPSPHPNQHTLRVCHKPVYNSFRLGLTPTKSISGSTEFSAWSLPLGGTPFATPTTACSRWRCLTAAPLLVGRHRGRLLVRCSACSAAPRLFRRFIRSGITAATATTATTRASTASGATPISTSSAATTLSLASLTATSSPSSVTLAASSLGLPHLSPVTSSVVAPWCTARSRPFGRFAVGGTWESKRMAHCPPSRLAILMLPTTAPALASVTRLVGPRSTAVGPLTSTSTAPCIGTPTCTVCGRGGDMEFFDTLAQCADCPRCHRFAGSISLRARCWRGG